MADAPAGSIERELHELVGLVPAWEPPAAEPEPAGEKETDPESEREGKPAAQRTRIVRLAGDLGIEFFHSRESVPYATVFQDGHFETHPLRSRAFRGWLARRFFLETETAPGAQALADALSVLEGRAIFEAPEQAVHVRVAGADGRVYLDLGDPDWRAVEIDRHGWRIVVQPPVRFRRNRGVLPLPMPVAGGSVDDLRPFLNISNPEDWLVLKAWLVQALSPTGPYPTLALMGEQGSAKSFASRLLKAVIDPNTAPLRRPPRDERDLMIAATNTWLLAFDNISFIPRWFSDGLCCLATGGGLSTRALYSDSDETILEATRPAILTGIEEYISQPDLLDRTIPIYLAPIREGRLDEHALWTACLPVLPGVLGALLTAVSCALRERDRIRLVNPPRMADFSRWIAAAAPALGTNPEALLAAYGGSREGLNDLPLEAAPIVPALRQVVRSTWELHKPWTGTASGLLTALSDQASDVDRKQKAWPRNPRMLSNLLRRLAPNLRADGMHIDFGQREAHTGRRLLVISPVEKGKSTQSSVTTVTYVTAESEHAVEGDASGPQGDASEARKSGIASPENERSESEGDVGDGGGASLRPHSTPLPSYVCPTPIFRVTAAEQLAGLLPALMREPLIALDTETTGLDPHSDRLRLVQVATADVALIIDCTRVDPAALLPLFLAADGPVLAGHNLAFDSRFLLAAGLPMPAGARLFDTQLAEQLLYAGRESPGFKLSDLAGRRLGVALSKERQRSDWAGELTEEQLRYAAADAAVVLPIVQQQRADLAAAGLERVAAIEMRALPAITWLEYAGAPFDAERWQALSDAAALEQIRFEQQLTEASGAADMLGRSQVNWASPEQVARLLRSRGQDLKHTDEATLRELAAREPVAALVLQYRDASKRATTYGIDWLRHVNPATGRIHPDYWQIGSKAGRMSCSRPNLQQIPRDPAYRACFRASDGRALVKADYSQIELRLAAQISGDAAMRAAFQRGEDLHALTAAAVLGKPAEAVTKVDRQVAKALNFALVYGAGPARLREHAATAYGVHLTEAEAVQFRARFFERYAGLRAWHRSIPEGEQETRTLAGRRRLGVARFTEKLNSPVQGSGAGILKLALARLWEHRDEAPSAVPILVVHDEIVLECDAAEAELAGEWLAEQMRAAAEEIMPDVPAVVEVMIAQDWAGTPAALAVEDVAE